ncbi:MAG: biosynthetic arginine decarboxylase [Methylotetracoccus sp.]|jgi:arginine decarboxylase|nr:biosynthetic arginine decarboxylase [Methylotetracoccus sp.]
MIPKAWTIQQARELYAIDHWSEGYFDIDGQGAVVVRPKRGAPGNAPSLREIAQAAKQEGLSLPLLVRFSDILKDRVALLHDAFETARRELGYSGCYHPVYPIKVNQQHSVVEALHQSGSAKVGLEAGSKSELLAILALAAPADIIICNGYKDRAYIRLALIGTRLGLNLFIVIEKLSELEIVLEESTVLGIAPQLGLRIRLANVNAGKWQNSGGEKSKFGLNASEIMKLIARLNAAGGLTWLQLMHFHMGSQVANINEIKPALREAGRYFKELSELGAPIRYADVGGGLGVDYEGTHSNSSCSINYSVQEYAQTIVRGFSEICAETALPEPQLITEAGRAMTAHHAVLITNIIDIESVSEEPPKLMDPSAAPVKELAELWQRVDGETPLGIFHDAQFDLQEARSLFAQGLVSLAELAQAERLASAIFCRIRHRLDVRLRAHREALDELNDRLADKVFCNFSVFQSMPDAWAIEQIFPVMPLQRLGEEPTRRAVIQDLTCDSDGCLTRYIDRQSIETTMPIHAVKEGEPYLIGIFMVGAYQEILGDMHNLFGDTHSVNVEFDDTGHYRFVDPVHGDGADDLLRYVHIDPDDLERAYRKKLFEAHLTPAQRKLYESELIAGLSGYTYLEE